MNLLCVSTVRFLRAWLLILCALAGLAHGQSLDAGFNADVNGEVRAVAVLPGGQIALGGNFSTVAGQSRQALARLHHDGTLDAAFTAAADTAVWAVAAQADGKLLLGGGFAQVGGLPHSGIGRINADGTVDGTFNPEVRNGTGHGVVKAMAVQPDGKILVGGQIYTVNGVARTALARLNADGTLDAAFAPSLTRAPASTPPQVLALAVLPSGKILLGGQFDTVGGQPRTNLARLNADGSLDTGFVQDANDAVHALAVQADGAAMVGGAFTQLGGQPRNSVARLNADGTLDAGFAPGTDGVVRALAVQPDGKVLVGGLFSTLDGQPRANIARLHASGAPDTAFAASANSMVRGIALGAGGQIVLGGNFTLVNGTARSGAARLHADGTLDVAPTASLDNTALALAAQPDGKLLVGGNFTGRLARLNADGSRDTGFTHTTSGTVYALAMQPDGKALVAGNFNDLGPGLARLNPDGSVDTAFAANLGAGADGGIYALALLPGGDIVLAGAFSTWNGATSVRLVRLRPDGTRNVAWNPPVPSNAVQTVAVQADGKLLVGGWFTLHLMRLEDDGSVDASFNPAPNQQVTTLAVQADGKILVGGYFGQIAGAMPPNARPYLARLNSDGTLDSAFDAGADWAVWSLAVQADGKIIVGGEFTALGGQAAGKIGRIHADGSRDLDFGDSANLTVYALAPLPGGHMVAGGAFFSFNGQPRASIARLSQPIAPQQTLAATPTRDGLRWLRAATAPEVAQVRLAYATQEDAPESAWTDVGAATRTPGGWALDGLALPHGQRLWVRAQGLAPGGYGNGSASLVQQTAMLYLAAAPDAPAAPTAVAGDAQATVSWAAPADNGSPITAYTVHAVQDASKTCAPALPGPLQCTVAGLVNGTAYTFTVVATNAFGDSVASDGSSAVTPLGAQAITGFADPGAQTLGTTLALAATATSTLPVAYSASGVCSVAGAIVSFSGTGNCTLTATQPGDAQWAAAAPQQISFAVHPATVTGGPGPVTVDVNGPAGCSVTPGSLQITAAPTPLPPGATAPLGALHFTATGCAGATVTVSATYPAGSLAGLAPYKHGPGGWFALGAVSGDTVTFSVADDGPGDGNTTATGVIEDPHAMLLLAAPSQAQAIPTLSQWGLLLLPALLGWLVFREKKPSGA